VFTSICALVNAYDGILLDAYGVLLDKTGPLPGAVALVERLEREGKPYLILTNSASRLPETFAAELAAMGFPVTPARILTSGMLLGPFFRAKIFKDARCLVLGPEESVEYVRRAGGLPAGPLADAQAEAVVIADQRDVTLDVMDRALSLVLQRLDTGQELSIVLCNPDLIYPVAPGRYGFTAGGLAAMLEAVVRERYPELVDPVIRLGKPHRPIFEEARRMLAADRLVMIGDQLATDILGANGFGIDSVLVRTGLSHNARTTSDGAARPTWQLRSLLADAPI
jgi:HAD superfamily hydrolase (TIGR01450 family)